MLAAWNVKQNIVVPLVWTVVGTILGFGVAVLYEQRVVSPREQQADEARFWLFKAQSTYQNCFQYISFVESVDAENRSVDLATSSIREAEGAYVRGDYASTKTAAEDTIKTVTTLPYGCPEMRVPPEQVAPPA